MSNILEVKSDDITIDTSKKIVEIELSKDENGFGFNITGGIDEPYIPGYDGCFITRIRPDGVAAKDGRLHVGDRVVSVNGQTLAGMTHDAAVSVFKNTTGTVNLSIEQDAELTVLSQPSTILPTPVAGSTGIIKAEPSEGAGTTTIIPESNKENGMTAVVIKEDIEVPNPKNISPIELKNQRDPPVISAPLEIPVSVGKDNDSAKIQKFPRQDFDDDRGSTFSGPPDDVPRTPKRPISILDPANPSVLTEAVFISIGVVALAAGIFVAVRWFRRK